MTVSAAVWNPLAMGYPIVEGYSYSSGRNLRGYNVADHYSEFAKLVQEPPSTANLTFLMSPTQFEYFEGFWRYNLLRGTLWFTMPLRIGFGVVDFDVHMLADKPYQADYILGNDSWEVAFPVEFGMETKLRFLSMPWLLNGGSGCWKMNGQDKAWLTNG